MVFPITNAHCSYQPLFTSQATHISSSTVWISLANDSVRTTVLHFLGVCFLHIQAQLSSSHHVLQVSFNFCKAFFLKSLHDSCSHEMELGYPAQQLHLLIHLPISYLYNASDTLLILCIPLQNLFSLQLFPPTNGVDLINHILEIISFLYHQVSSLHHACPCFCHFIVYISISTKCLKSHLLTHLFFLCLCIF